MDAHVAQWIGSRAKQEDAYAVRHFPEGTLALVCDGMGGHHCGDVASATAAQAFAEHFAQSGNAASVLTRLRQALNAANEAVARELAERCVFGGTTLTAVFASPRILYRISVGDSPLFIWRRGKLHRLNEDHSMRSVYDRYVCAGGMTHREACRNGHMLRSALTGSEIPMVDAPVIPYPLLPGDRLLLCTDGVEPLLAEEIPSRELRHLLDADSGLAGLLVEACRARADEYADNVTVVTLEVPRTPLSARF